MEERDRVEKHPLRSGSVCMRHRCVECCIGTRMPLSRSDISRILKMDYKFKDFAARTEEGWRLRNRSGRCVFLSEKGCRIYTQRPEGCQLYPLVYDEASHKAVLDHLCPHSHEFQPTEKEMKELMILLDDLATDRGSERPDL